MWGCTYTCTYNMHTCRSEDRSLEMVLFWQSLSSVSSGYEASTWTCGAISQRYTSSLEQQQPFYYMSWFLSQKPSKAQVGRSGSVVLTGF